MVGDTGGDIKGLLTAATSLPEATQIVQNALVAKLVRLMFIDTLNIEPSNPMHNYGVDSLVAIEMRTWIFRELGSNVSVFDILSSVPLTSLAATIAMKSELVSAVCKNDQDDVAKE